MHRARQRARPRPRNRSASRGALFINTRSPFFIVTLSITLSDEAGALSNLITELYRAGANILTVNQNIPIDGVAPVSISVRTDALRLDIEQLLELVSLLDGVVDVKRVSGQ